MGRVGCGAGGVLPAKPAALVSCGCTWVWLLWGKAVLLMHCARAGARPWAVQGLGCSAGFLGGGAGRGGALLRGRAAAAAGPSVPLQWAGPRLHAVRTLFASFAHPTSPAGTPSPLPCRKRPPPPVPQATSPLPCRKHHSPLPCRKHHPPSHAAPPWPCSCRCGWGRCWARPPAWWWTQRGRRAARFAAWHPIRRRSSRSGCRTCGR